MSGMGSATSQSLRQRMRVTTSLSNHEDPSTSSLRNTARVRGVNTHRNTASVRGVNTHRNTARVRGVNTHRNTARVRGVSTHRNTARVRGGGNTHRNTARVGGGVIHTGTLQELGGEGNTHRNTVHCTIEGYVLGMKLRAHWYTHTHITSTGLDYRSSIYTYTVA